MNYKKNNTEEAILLKGKKIAKITLLIICIIVVCLIVASFYVYRSFTTKTYIELKINNDNRAIILNLLEQEKDNISISQKIKYCDSMYKIEYMDGFPDGTNYTIYCKEENNIEFSIDKVGEDVLHTYILKNGSIVKRKIK